MKSSGQIALVPFPYTDLTASKLRPVLLLCQTPGVFDDWLVCMISSQLHQAHDGFDEPPRFSWRPFGLSAGR